jgi:hypothetical protein
MDITDLPFNRLVFDASGTLVPTSHVDWFVTTDEMDLSQKPFTK